MRSDDLLKLLTSLQKADIVDITVLEVCSYTDLNISHNISISGCIFKEEIIFTDCHFSQAITFKNCKFEKGICFNRCTFKDSFTLESTDIQEETIFRDCTIASVLFNETHFKDVLFCGYLKNSAIKNEDFVFQNANIIFCCYNFDTVYQNRAFYFCFIILSILCCSLFTNWISSVSSLSFFVRIYLAISASNICNTVKALSIGFGPNCNSGITDFNSGLISIHLLIISVVIIITVCSIISICCFDSLEKHTY